MSSGAPTAKALFLDALELAAAERAGFLEAACGGDAELRAAVDELLAAHAEADSGASTLGGSAIEGLASQVLAELDFSPGDVVGDYRLEELLGEGGFGHVWRAEQLRPVQRHVALKILKLGMDSRRVMARFEAERQVLARMDHPNIARVLDAGATPEGRPYFVMELVAGEPITAYCDRRRLSLGERLELFRETCLALQHAHSKGILHRDVKPGNVLVTEVDGSAQPRVIDFGVAKAVTEDEVGASQLTVEGHLVGTPAYMSPEQMEATGGERDVDTRSDVYALGVLLYELIAGGPPFETQSSGIAAFLDLQRQIREEDPQPPSVVRRRSRATSPGDDVRERGAQGPVPPEVDWICLRAIERNRERRYATAFALADDVGKLLAGLPVDAAPPSPTYRFRKLVARHRAASLFAAAALLALVLGAAGTTVGLVRAADLNEELGVALGRAEDEAAEAQAQSEIAEAVNAFLTEDLLRAARPSVAEGRGRDVSMSEVLDVAAQRLDAAAAPGGRFEGKARVEGRVRHAIGQTYVALGRDEDAEPQLVRALALLTGELGEHHPEALRSAIDLADAELGLARYAEADERLRALIPVLRDVLGPADPNTLTALRFRATALRQEGREDESAALQEEGLAAARAAGAERSAAAVGLLHSLAMHAAERHEFDEAERLFREVIELRTEENGYDAPSTLGARSNFAVCLLKAGRDEEALALLEETVPAMRRTLGDQHADTLIAMQNLASTYYGFGRVEEGAELAAATHAATLAQRGPDHPETLNTADTLAFFLDSQGRFDEALHRMQDTLERSERALGPEHPDTASRIANLGVLFFRHERYDEAEPYLLRALELHDELLGRSDRVTIAHVSRLTKIHRSRGEDADAELLLREGLERAAGFAEADPQLLALRWDLCELCRDHERWDEALELLTLNLNEVQAVHGIDDQRGFATAALIVDTYVRAGRLDEARELEAKILPYLEWRAANGMPDDTLRPPP